MCGNDHQSPPLVSSQDMLKNKKKPQESKNDKCVGHSDAEGEETQGKLELITSMRAAKHKEDEILAGCLNRRI